MRGKLFCEPTRSELFMTLLQTSGVSQSQKEPFIYAFPQ